MVGWLKDRTSHAVRANYPFRRKLPPRWSPSFFASTAGNIFADTIQRYIAAQAGT